MAVCDTLPTQEAPHSNQAAVKWPIKCRHRKNSQVLAKIYNSEGRSGYRVAWHAAGRRMIKSFQRFAGSSGAREFADQLVKDLAQGSAVPTLTAAEARSALAVRDALENFRHRTGRQITAIQAVTEYLAAAQKLGERSLADAVSGYLSTVATVTRKDVSEAVAEFIAARAEKTKAPEGKRAQLSVSYAYDTGRWLGWFAKMFPAAPVCDLDREHMDLFMKGHSHLGPKSKNHLRATLKMFLRWCVKHDYLSKDHRLLDAPSMEGETLTEGETDFNRPAEFRAMLEAADHVMRPTIALRGLAGVRLSELERLTWADVFDKSSGHITVTGLKAKTRFTRLVEICPALAAWLRPYRGQEGRVWTKSLSNWHSHFGKLRVGLKLHGGQKVPARKNGLRHAFCTYHFALYSDEKYSSAQAGNSVEELHRSYKGLATKKQAQAWFAVKPDKAAPNIVPLVGEGTA